MLHFVSTWCKFEVLSHYTYDQSHILKYVVLCESICILTLRRVQNVVHFTFVYIEQLYDTYLYFNLYL